ncbi:MAG: rhodanese-like domain-containing protein [Rhodospirillales bacterium]|nr:rhodanese-like domain-containing protein [Rhodospirillales bacterium]
MSPRLPLRELAATDVADGLRRHAILLVDVREPAEYAAERIHGALLFPLSSFDPTALPVDPARPIVFHCGSGKRSLVAVAKCQEAGVPAHTHLKGGMIAWKNAGGRTITLDAATGGVVDRR